MKSASKVYKGLLSAHRVKLLISFEHGEPGPSLVEKFISNNPEEEGI
jgi:hypothetical protein